MNKCNMKCVKAFFNCISFCLDSLQVISNDSQPDSHLSHPKDLRKDILTRKDFTIDQRQPVEMLDKSKVLIHVIFVKKNKIHICSVLVHLLDTMTSRQSSMIEPLQRGILCDLTCPSGLSPTKALLPKSFNKL
jgi:hypothetical protein